MNRQLRSSTPIPSASASAPIAGVPEARQGGFLVEDPGGGQLLLIGGIGSSAMVGSTWSWDGRRWSQLNAPAQGIDMVFLDSVRNQVIALQATGPTAYGTATWSGTWANLNSTHVPSRMVFGSGFSVFNPTTKSGLYCGIRNETTDTPGLETWTWDGSDWSFAPVAGPAKRLDYALAYDPITKTDILFGGEPGGGPHPLFADTWSWNGSGWTQLLPTHSPAAGAAYATLDESLNAVVLLDWQGNMWTWTGSDWNAIPSTNSGPGAHVLGAAFGYDPLSHRIIAFGGSTGSSASSTTWLWDGASWATAT